MTGGDATGNNDVFNGKNRIFWWLASQNPLAGANGESSVHWCWAVSFTVGDQCHRIQSGVVVLNGATVYNNSLPHVFNSGHNHPGDYPYVNTIAQGGFGSGVVTIPHDANGNANIVMTGSHFGSSGPQSVSNINTALPQIPQDPAAPTTCTATRVSDTQQTVNWANNSTGTAPYANIKVYRATDAGGYALIATLGVVTTYSDTNTSANHKYTYRVSAVGVNTVESGFATASPIWTTPGTPTSLVATKLAGGNIRLDWTNNVNFSEYTVRIEESQNGGAYAELTSVATGVITYEHVAPNAGVTHKYRIRARTTTGTTLNSAYSNESATIVLLSTAGAPTGLAPSGSARDATEAIVFTWTHNPTDGTPQSKYQLQYKVNAGSFVTVGPTTSTVSSFTMTAGTLSNGDTITWHVATAAENGTIGAYSADSVFTTSARPTSTISQPTGGTWNLSTLEATWTYFQAQSSAQASWHAFLYHKISATFADAVLIGEQSGSGTTATVSFPGVTLLDAETYGVRVYVTSAAGLQSSDAGTDLEEFTVAYLPPADLTLAIEYDADFGRMVLTLTGDSAVGGVTEPISTVDLQRKIDGGEWVTWVVGIVLDPSSLMAILIDTMPTINGSNVYRAVVRSAVPSSMISPEVEVITTEPRWGFLTTGASFDELIRVRARLSQRELIGRAKATYTFAGREDDTELSGESVKNIVAVQGTLYPPSRGGASSEPEALKELAKTKKIVLWRDYTGRRMFASLSDVAIDYNTDSVLYPVGFNLGKVGYNENVA